MDVFWISRNSAANAQCSVKQGVGQAPLIIYLFFSYDGQVSKTAPTGEYLTTGSFMIRGIYPAISPSIYTPYHYTVVKGREGLDIGLISPPRKEELHAAFIFNDGLQLPLQGKIPPANTQTHTHTQSILSQCVFSLRVNSSISHIRNHVSVCVGGRAECVQAPR